MIAISSFLSITSERSNEIVFNVHHRQQQRQVMPIMGPQLRPRPLPGRRPHCLRFFADISACGGPLLLEAGVWRSD